MISNTFLSLVAVVIVVGIVIVALSELRDDRGRRDRENARHLWTKNKQSEYRNPDRSDWHKNKNWDKGD